MIQTILFDLGVVLIHINPLKSIHTISEKVHMQPQRVLDLFYNSTFYRDYEKGLIDDMTFYRGILKELNGDYDFEYFKTLWNNIFAPNDPMIELLPKLKSKYQLVMISNTNKMHIDYCKEHIPLFDHFDHLVFSHEVGYVKPDPIIFKYTLQLANTTPQQCFYIDDIYNHVQSASSLGIHSYVYTTFDRLIKALHTFQIL